jgi:hypothetical protein
VPPAKAGVLRHVVDPASLAAWRFDARRSLRWTSPADRAAYVVAAALPAKPRVGRTDDGAVWLVDGASRRAFGGAEALAAWSIDAASVAELDAADAAVPEGLPLPSRPVLVQAVGAPEIYLLDVDPITAVDPGVEAPDENDPALHTTGRRHELTGPASDGCNLGRARGTSGSDPIGFGLIALALAAMRRRSRA